MDKVVNVTYASSLTDLCEVNPSFDTGVLKIAYHGDNRNKSSISKEVFENALKTMYGCPVVCHYDRESDTLGGHDMEVVRDSEGDLRLVNLTTPVGFVPYQAKNWWETIEEEDGTEHEYLFTEVLLWKRQEAYKKIKEDGITAQSMEITVNDGESKDGIYHIYDFTFTAFALIGVEPCFESAALEFSKADFKQQISEMMQDYNSFNLVDTSNEVGNIHPHNYSMEGGKEVLEDNKDLIVDTVAEEPVLEEAPVDPVEPSEDAPVDADFEANEDPEATPEDPAAEDAPIEEPEVAPAEPEVSEDPVASDDSQDEPSEDFALNSNIESEIHRCIIKEKYTDEYGEWIRYWMIDFDLELSMVYAYDDCDGLLYGFPFVCNGDNIEIDFEGKKRMKCVIAEFDEGEDPSQNISTFKRMADSLKECESKYQAASDTIASMQGELDELREFKNDADSRAIQAERDSVFAKFEDLVGVEAFEALRENCAEYDAETLEEKCFAIRGRNGSKFAYESKAPKIKVEKTNIENEPYGGIVEKYLGSKK
ncbi:MAG: hypothetical protein KBS82_05565 [Oscillospiraceae bacterium]|nr:hypothetical protein [Candidatus Limimonas egerieequi]